uniref:Uncharacterized protein n=1 Tax=Manihot esculenta TaxID=3983 RepID=A0A2C9V2W0_MANES
MALDTILAIVPTIIEFTVVPIKRHLCYAFNYKSKVEKLKNQLQKLTRQRDDLLQSVDQATRQGDRVNNSVQEWLTSVNKAIEEAEEILIGEQQAKEKCFFGVIPDLKKRYKLSKKADKEALAVVELQDEGRFDRISYRPLLEPIVVPSIYDNEALHSRVSILKKVMDALMDPAVDMIGVYGMGGIGKTTLANEVHRKAIEDKLFDVVVMATVSETPELRKIQGTIADMLGLKLEEETEEGRACRLHQRLVNEKKILIILDDIWEKLEPKKVGIPFGSDHKGCKLLLTSRREDILSREMGTQESFELRVLSEAEAWSLFQTMVGDITNQALHSVATEVAKKCAGLPVLIVTVARALKNKDLHEWKLALKELSRVDNEGIQAKVYSALELSYNHLASHEAKSLFLLCAQIAQGDIRIRDLLIYSMGLDLLRSKYTVEDARNRVDKLVSNLKASCLLLDCNKNGYVKMHDVVRDAALSIASKSQHLLTFRDIESKIWPNRDLKNCSRIYLPYCEIDQLPERLECPELELLVLGRGNIHSEGPDLKISDLFFEGITKLKVLRFTGMCLWSLSPSLGYLTNLLTLCLDGCVLRDASVIGELERLEILSFRESKIEQLPGEIAQLTRLKLLDLSNCYKLQVIPANVISRLSLLEELYMENSFCQWELQSLSNSSKASLAELKYLSHLTTLEIYIPDSKMLPKDLFSNKLERYIIVIGKRWYWGDEYESSRMLKLNTSVYLDHGVGILLKETEDLSLNEVKGIKSILYDLNWEGFPQLKHLQIRKGYDIQYIINSTARVLNSDAFPILESLHLENLVSLEKLYHGQLTAGSFTRLSILKVNKCNRLKNLLPISMIRSLSQLREMEVSNCKSMEEIVLDDSGVGDDKIEVAEFAQLRSLTLRRLPILKSIWFKVKAMPALQMQTTNEQGFEGVALQDEFHSPLPLFDKMVSFPKLEVLNVYSVGCENKQDDLFFADSSNSMSSSSVLPCQDLKYLFTTSFVKTLLQLKKLQIEDCEFMEGIILAEEFVEEMMNKILFLNLNELNLKNLPNLTRFCDGHLIDFCCLDKLSIVECPAFKTLVSNPLCADIMVSKKPKEVDLDRNQDTASPPLFDEKVAFPSLESLCINGISNLEMTWHTQLPEGSFCKLKSLSIQDCKNLKTLFPSNNLARFQRLEGLSLFDCHSLQEIYQLQGFNAEEASSVLSFDLKQLYISGLQGLKNIWSTDPQGILTFQNLESIHLLKCKILKNLFPSSIAKDLLKLGSLQLDSCGIEEIVTKAEGVEAAPSFVFPRLVSMRLEGLPKIRNFYPGTCHLEFPKLKYLTVLRCGKGIQFASDFFNLQEKYGEDQCNNSIQQPMSLAEKIFISLEQLSLDGQVIEAIIQYQFQKKFFFNVKSINLHHIQEKSSIALFGFLQGLSNLESLCVRDSSLEELFRNEGLDDGTTVPLIRKLNLYLLGDLKHMWKPHPKLDLALAYVEAMTVSGCPNLINLAPASASFQDLTTLEVGCCKALKHLVTSAAAKSMVQLLTMKIRTCKMLTEIVTDEGDGTEEIVFCKLKTLELVHLQSLTGFCLGGLTFKFPCLEVITISGCPNMRIFCGGILSTPKLQCVDLQEIHFQSWRWEGNLNATVQQSYLEMEGFYHIWNMKLSKFPHLREKWQSQLPLNFLVNISKLAVDKLKVLIVEQCDSLEKIFDLEGMNADEGHAGLMPWLQELHLIDLPKLRHIWSKDPQGILSFKNLKLLNLYNCSSLRNIFTLPMALDLVRLESMEVNRCNMLEHIINKEGEREDEEVWDKTIFPSLQSISLESLPSLTSFYSGSDVLCPSLKQVDIVDCPKMMNPFPQFQ